MMSRVILKSLLYIVALLICIASLYYFHFMVVGRNLGAYFDLSIFTDAAQHAWQRKDIYVRGEDLPYLFSPGAPVFKFPLPYLFLFMPWMTNGVPDIFKDAYCAFMSAAFLLSGALSCSALLIPLRAQVQILHSTLPAFGTGLFVVLCVVVTSFFFPFMDALGGVCGENIILLFLLLGFMLMARYPFIAGMIIAYTAWMKLYPAFMLIYIISKRQWGVLYGWLFGFAGIFLVSLSIIGIKENMYYLGTVLPILLHEEIAVHWENVNFIYLLYGRELIQELNGPAFMLFRAALILPLLYVLLSRRPTVFWRDTAEYAWVISTMLLCLPNMWSSYHVYLLFPVLVMLGILILHGMWFRLFLFAWVAFCLIANDVWLWQIAEKCCDLQRNMPLSTEIAQEIEQYGPNITMLRHSVTGWLIFWTSNLRPLTPITIWLVYAAWLLPRRE